MVAMKQEVTSQLEYLLGIASSSRWGWSAQDVSLCFITGLCRIVVFCKPFARARVLSVIHLLGGDFIFQDASRFPHPRPPFIFFNFEVWNEPDFSSSEFDNDSGYVSRILELGI